MPKEGAIGKQQIKNMKLFKILSALILLILCIGFNACEDEDILKGGAAEKAIIGTWQSTWLEGYDKDLNNPQNNEEWNEALKGEKQLTITIKADHTGTSDGDTFTWKLDNKKFTIKYDDEDATVSTLLKLTSTEMIVERKWSDSDEEGPSEHYKKITFKKVKDNNEGALKDEKAIIGTWKSTWWEGYYKDLNNPENNDEWNEATTEKNENQTIITIRADHTGTSNHLGASNDSSTFTWKLDDKKFTITYDNNEEENPSIATLLKLTSTEMIMESKWSDPDTVNPSESYDKITFKKVK